jgi:hypothetical protein
LSAEDLAQALSVEVGLGCGIPCGPELLHEGLFAVVGPIEP